MTTPIAKPFPRRDRWVLFLSVTVILNLTTFLLFPEFVTDALTAPMALLWGVPTLWGLYSFLCFRTRKERVVGYFAIAPTALWSLAALSLLSEYGWSG